MKNPNFEKLTAPEQLRSIRIIASSLIVGAVLFTIVSQIIHEPSFETDFELYNLLFPIAIILSGVSIGTGYIITNRIISSIEKDQPLRSKFATYASSVIIRMATAEGPLLFMVVAFIISGHFNFIILTTVCWVAFFVYFPRKQKIISDLDLNSTEIRELEGES